MKNKRENGEVVVEASIIVTLVLIFITIMLYLGIVMYQQTLISVIANQTASNIAQVYSNNIKDPFTGHIDVDDIYQSVTYGNMKNDAYMDVIEQKANVYAQYRLKSSSMLAAQTTSVEVDIVKKPNELLKSQIVVTIHSSYDVPLVAMFGPTGLVEFAASGRADCVDILEYINGVEAVGDPMGSNIEFLPDFDKCTVTFIADRNNPLNSTTVTVLRRESIASSYRYTHSKMPKIPTNGTFVFAGWFDESNRAFSESTIIEENMVIYGSWKCKVTLNADGGKVNGQDSYSYEVPVGSRSAFATPKLNGYSFMGWFTQKDGKGIRYLSNDTPINGDVTLYAYWICKHDQGYSTATLHQFTCRAIHGGESVVCEQCKRDCRPEGVTNSYYVKKCITCKKTVDPIEDETQNIHYGITGYTYDTSRPMKCEKASGQDDFEAACDTPHSTTDVKSCYSAGAYNPDHAWGTYRHILCSYCKKFGQPSRTTSSSEDSFYFASWCGEHFSTTRSTGSCPY